MLAYFDLFSGISGDMTLGAFIDLGVPVDWLAGQLQQMPLSGFRLSAADVTVHGISAKRVCVEALPESESRNYSRIRALIQESRLAERVKDRSLAVFERIAAAEAAIHKCTKEEVHFHELGGIDAIVDIVGAALCLEFLGIEAIESSRVPLGSGFVRSRHGVLPVPAPATLAILKGVPVYGSDATFELVTPTGAAIVATVSRAFGKMPEMIVDRVGYGAGSHVSESAPNLLRVVIGRAPEADAASPAGCEDDTVLVLETDIDDMNPEVLGYTAERLFAAGALDVILHPVYMKKNRPGTLLQVLCRQREKNRLIGCILSETTSLGVRYYHARRRILKRAKAFVQTPFGRVQVKKIIELSGRVRLAPEYDSCREIAAERGIPIQKIYDAVLKETGSQ